MVFVKYYIVIVTVLALNLFWARRAGVHADNLPAPRLWKLLIGLFAGMNLFIVSLLFATRPLIKSIDFKLPISLMSVVDLWHIIVLPVVIGLLFLGRGWKALTAFHHRRQQAPAVHVSTELMREHPTRRQMLTSAMMVIAPPVATGGLVAFGYHQRYDFRIRQMQVPIANLPPALDGLRIAHLSDTHIGAFTNSRVLNAVVEATNALKADLVCFTGDLLDFSLSDLAIGFDFLDKLDPRHGFALCVGNHDLHQNGPEYRRRLLEHRYPLLLNTKKDFSINGQTVQLLGLDWGTLSSEGPHNLEQHMARLMPQVDHDKFPILLAHHPHALDLAAKAGVPLVLAGHTHGGQMNLTNQIGGGSLMFKYWSGLYRKDQTSLVVSNGIGSWFPIRVNAPAELIEITLRRSPA